MAVKITCLCLLLCVSICLCLYVCVSVCVSVLVDTPDEADKSLPEDDLQKNLAFLLDRVEGCSVCLSSLSCCFYFSLVAF